MSAGMDGKSRPLGKPGDYAFDDPQTLESLRAELDEPSEVKLLAIGMRPEWLELDADIREIAERCSVALDHRDEASARVYFDALRAAVASRTKGHVKALERMRGLA